MHVPGLVKIDAAQERELIVDVLRQLGASADEASEQASALVEGDLRGRHSHGVQCLPVIVERIRDHKGLSSDVAEIVTKALQ